MKNRNLIRSILAAIVLCGAVAFNINAADSDIDSSFVSRLVGGTNSQFIGVETVMVQPDGKMLVGGTFNTFASRLQLGIGRLNADGSPDYAFNPNANNSVYAVAVQADGKVLIGGDFTQVGGQARNRLARLNADGSLDASFQNPSVNQRVYAITVQTDGKILIGGSFDGVGAQSRNSLARLNTDGSLDTGFGNSQISTGNSVYAITIQTDGKILVGGDMFIGPGFQRYLGRVNADGTFDSTFPDVVGVGSVRRIKILADGKLMISGSFAFIGPSGSSVNRNRIARLNANGSLDPSFGNVTEISASTIYDFAVLPNGQIVIGGSFSYQSNTRNGLARLNGDGTLDATYDPRTDGQIRSLALQSDGKLVVGGYFSFMGGQSRRNIVRLNPNGSPEVFPKDLSLNSTGSSRGRVRAIVLQPDGKILVGGYFT